MNDVDWTSQLAEQLDRHWRTQLWPRLVGLTDAEYRWEPVARWPAASSSELPGGARELTERRLHAGLRPVAEGGDGLRPVTEGVVQPGVRVVHR